MLNLVLIYLICSFLFLIWKGVKVEIEYRQIRKECLEKGKEGK